MEERHRLTREEIDERHPRLLPALREHPHVGWLLVRSERDGPLALGARRDALSRGRPRRGRRPARDFSPNAPQHLLRTDGFEHVADIMVGSFYDPDLDEGCAFEELISFHGGIGGAADAAVPAGARRAAAAGRADRRRGRRARRPLRLAPTAERPACNRSAGGQAARCGSTVIPAAEARLHPRRAPAGRAQLRARARPDHRRLRLHVGGAEQRVGRQHAGAAPEPDARDRPLDVGRRPGRLEDQHRPGRRSRPPRPSRCWSSAATSSRRSCSCSRGCLTIATIATVALGIVDQGEANVKAVTGAVCVYVLIGLLFVFLYGVDRRAQLGRLLRPGNRRDALAAPLLQLRHAGDARATATTRRPTSSAGRLRSSRRCSASCTS